MKLSSMFVRAFLFLLVLPLAAADAPRSRTERILQQQQKQQQIQRTTQRVGDQLSAIIYEFERNGIAGEDVKVLKAIRTVLGRLSEQDMAQVISLLQQAQKADDSTATRNAAEAYSGQKTIITQFKQLLLEYQRQQALYELSIMLRGLAARQSANMRIGVWLARQTEQKQFSAFNEDEKRYLNQQEIDQAALKDEVALVLKKLETLARESEGAPTGERPRAALEQARNGGLISALESAVEDLKSARLLSATGNEKRARDQMRDVARTLLLSRDLIDLLRAAIQETEQAILLQKQTIEFTRKIERREEARDAEDKQFEVVDNTDLIRRDINDVAPSASSYLRSAIERMQEARAVLNESKDAKVKAREAPVKQNEAITHLELARRALQDQLARAEEDAATPENALANLRELQKQVEALIQKEETLKTETAALENKPQELKTKAPVQGDIRDQTQEVQQKAADDAPAAAEALSAASREMETSQKDLARSRNSPEAQQEAIDSLKRAKEELAKEIAKLEEAEKQLAALEELLKKLEKVIEDQQQVRLQTAREMVKPKPDPLEKISGEQQQLGTRTGELQQETQEPVPTAAAHLGQAKSQMGVAKAQLDQSQPRSAQPPQTTALNELYAAKREIENKMNELRDELGMPNDPAQSLADAAAAIEKAQQEVNEAMSQMANMPPELMESLQKQQQAIADALSTNAREMPGPEVSQAQQAASRAAQQLGQNDLKNAISSMKQAEKGIGAAKGKQGEQPPPNAPPGEQPVPSLAQLGTEQTDVREMAEQLLEAQEAAPAQAMQMAAELLEQALNDISPIAAGEAGQLPASAQSALQSAQSSLTDASAQAGARQKAPAQANASEAADALAQAKAALALAQAGLGAEMAGQGQQPGQGQGQGQQPGQGQGQGQQPGRGQGTPAPRGTGDTGNWTGAGGASGARRSADGAGTFVGLPQRDRAAIQQSQAEKYPQEYGPLVEQYLKNLSDAAGE